MPTKRYDQKAGVFVLSEPGHAVTFIPANRIISIHSAERNGGCSPHPHDCEYVCPDAYCDGSFLSGAELLERWEESGCDNQLVWAELARWFDSYFPAKENA